LSALTAAWLAAGLISTAQAATCEPPAPGATLRLNTDGNDLSTTIRVLDREQPVRVGLTTSRSENCIWAKPR
jgi:hypothetical protein